MAFIWWLISPAGILLIKSVMLTVAFIAGYTLLIIKD